MPLESYKERYTYQLQNWSTKAFTKAGISFTVVEGERLSETIELGQVLDAHGRPYYSLTQIANLVKLLQKKDYSNPNSDVIFFEDLFSPGYEALPYIFEQVKHPPKIFTRCLAQTVDSDDFTFPWRNWMRPFEELVSQTVDGIFIANTAMGINMQIAKLDKAPLYVTGLSFDASEVLSRVPYLRPWKERSTTVIYTSRFDIEKQPHFYLDLVERVKRSAHNKFIKFKLLGASKELRSTDPSALVRAKEYAEKGWLTILTDLSKNEYYEQVSKAKVLFNCSLQDWQSNTLNDACALNTAPLFPAYKSFPEALFNNKNHLYIPWSLDDAEEKLLKLANTSSLEFERYIYDITNRVAAHQTATIERIIKIIKGEGEEFLYKPYNYGDMR